MKIKPIISIIIVTRNRLESLRSTMESIIKSLDSSAIPTEVIVVDNGASDGTADFLKNLSLIDERIRYLREERPGQARGKNSAIEVAKGRVFVFTDDDVRVPSGWPAAMAEPIISNQTDIVAGAVRLSSDILRIPWMTEYFRALLASTESGLDSPPKYLVGANFAASSTIFQHGLLFPVELGPGALGYHDESFFYWRARQLNYRAIFLPDVIVEHHCSISRFTPSAWRKLAHDDGISEGYIAYHWGGERLTSGSYSAWWKCIVKLMLLRLFSFTRKRTDCPVSIEEMKLIKYIQQFWKIFLETGKPRKYISRNTGSKVS